MLTCCEDFISQCEISFCHRVKHHVSTYCFLDIETTGLLQLHKEVYITEIALVCVDRDNLQNVTTNGLPRVLHKLCLPVNPEVLVEHGSYCLLYTSDAADEGLGVDLFVQL